MRQDTLKDANFRAAESVTYLVMYLVTYLVMYR